MIKWGSPAVDLGKYIRHYVIIIFIRLLGQLLKYADFNENHNFEYETYEK